MHEPEVLLSIQVSGQELMNGVLRFGQLQIPIPPDFAQNPAGFIANFWKLDAINIDVIHKVGENYYSVNYPSHGLFRANPNLMQYHTVVLPSGGKTISSGAQASNADSLPQLIRSIWRADMFYFNAERMTVGESQAAHEVRLQPNAANLPNVLHVLSGERGDLFQKLVRHLREIFQTVGNLSVRTKPVSGSVLEVLVWPTEAMERAELSFPLNLSGTGVSQVIALLAAIMTADNTIIIIDEINSFLHPAAVKSLLRIIQTEYKNHQYIISTHAPEVISFSNAKTLHIVKRAGYQSIIESLNVDQVGKFREVAEHLGVSMADVFAAERVIWVEGPTEELCFPYIYQKMVGPLPRGTVITSVAATGDFNTLKRDPAIVYEVYSRLSAAAATLVVSVIFSFDTEKLTEADRLDMQKKSGGLLHFLPRRHLECYLISPAAIAAFVISRCPELSGIVTEASAEHAIRAAANEQSLKIKEWIGDIDNSQWLERVDAAKLIVIVCGNLSNQKVPFSKKSDSLFLLSYIVENEIERLEPLRDYVASLVSAVI